MLRHVNLYDFGMSGQKSSVKHVSWRSLDAILDFEILKMLKPLESVFNSYLVPQSICLDTLFMILACQKAVL